MKKVLGDVLQVKMSWEKSSIFNSNSCKIIDTKGLQKMFDWNGKFMTVYFPFPKLPEYLHIIRSLYENKKACFVQRVKLSWFRRDEVRVSMDVPFDVGMKEADAFVYATNKELITRVKKIFEDEEKLEKDRADRSLMDIVNGTAEVVPSAPPQEQVEGLTSA